MLRLKIFRWHRTVRGLRWRSVLVRFSTCESACFRLITAWLAIPRTCKILIARTAPLSTTLIQYLCLFFAGALLSPSAAASAPNVWSCKSIGVPLVGETGGLCLFTRISTKQSNPDIHQTEKRVSQTEGPLPIFTNLQQTIYQYNYCFIAIFFIRRIRRLFKSMHINARLMDSVHLYQGPKILRHLYSTG